MKAIFKFGANDSVKQIIFHDEERDPCMEIHAQNIEIHQSLFEQLGFYLQINSLGEASIKLNFTIENAGNNIIKIKGNIYNALDLMKDRELIDKNLISHIDNDEDELLKDFIKESRKFEIPVTKNIQISEMHSDEDSTKQNSRNSLNHQSK